MIRIIGYLLICIFSFFLVLSNHIIWKSTKYQSILFKDAENDSFIFNLEDLDKFNQTFPSLAFNSVPNKTYISRYYTNSNNFEKAIQLLKEGMELNPYSSFTLYLMSRNYIFNEDIQGSLQPLEKAFELSPNIESISSLYFVVLSELNKDEKLKKLFTQIQDIDSYNIWKFYLQSLKNLKINQQDPIFFQRVQSAALDKFEMNISLD